MFRGPSERIDGTWAEANNQYANSTGRIEGSGMCIVSLGLVFLLRSGTDVYNYSVSVDEIVAYKATRKATLRASMPLGGHFYVCTHPAISLAVIRNSHTRFMTKASQYHITCMAFTYGLPRVELAAESLFPMKVKYLGDRADMETFWLPEDRLPEKPAR